MIKLKPTQFSGKKAENVFGEIKKNVISSHRSLKLSLQYDQSVNSVKLATKQREHIFSALKIITAKVSKKK